MTYRTMTCVQSSRAFIQCVARTFGPIDASVLFLILVTEDLC
jgi:hypothetical protein